jgi:hypothetical protein
MDILESIECTGENDEAREEDPSEKARKEVVHAWYLFEYHIRVP